MDNWFSGIVRDAYGRRAYGSDISVYVYVYWFSGIMRDVYNRHAYGSNILHRVYKHYKNRVYNRTFQMLRLRVVLSTQTK